ncbi:MAG: glucose-6-phosphate isomerase, partial [Bacilli bacterium]|nr:glucose-6-phosphate isomerase [Bacilli bacterium]
MEKYVKLDYRNALPFISEQEIQNYKPFVETCHHLLHEKKGAGSDFLGWLDWPERYDKEEFDRILKAATKIRRDSKILVVIGIGGSYLGAKAAIEALSHHFYQLKDDVKVLFAGQNISSSYLHDLIDVLKDTDFSINVISKSGTTTEPAIAFRVLKKLLEDKYGKEEA